MATPAMTAPARLRSVSMAATVRPLHPARNLNGAPSVDCRLSDRWNCQRSTARARRQRALDDILAVIDAHLALGDTDAVGHIVALIDATLAGRTDLPRLDAIYIADKCDAEEDVKEAEYRRNPCVRTAREWFDALGRQGRSTEPAMAALRAEWEF